MEMLKELLLLHGACFLVNKTVLILTYLNSFVYNLVVLSVRWTFVVCDTLLYFLAPVVE